MNSTQETVRTARSVIVRLDVVTTEGQRRTRYYGPFLPHVGSATTSFEQRIKAEAWESGMYRDVEVDVFDVFIGEDESDCRIEATR